MKNKETNISLRSYFYSPRSTVKFSVQNFSLSYFQILIIRNWSKNNLQDMKKIFSKIEISVEHFWCSFEPVCVPLNGKKAAASAFVLLCFPSHFYFVLV